MVLIIFLVLPSILECGKQKKNWCAHDAIRLQCARFGSMMMKFKRLFLIVPLMSSLLGAQESTYKLNVNVDLTEVHVNVTDEKDHPIGNLTKENFRLFEDRTEQKIAVFKH